MEFDIDISGEDLLNKDYTVCVANERIIKGFKINANLAGIISSRYGQNIYRYKKSKKGKALLKIRIYSIIIYYLFKSINPSSSIILNICRDFDGREEDIKSNLNYFLVNLLGIQIDKIDFHKLNSNSNAHKYAYLMRKDNKNKLSTYVNISLNNIEKYLKK